MPNEQDPANASPIARPGSDLSITLGVFNVVGAIGAKSLTTRLGIATFVVLAAVALQALLQNAREELLAYVTLFPAVVIAASLGRLAGGILAAILSTVFVVAWIAPPRAAADWISLAAFIVTSAMIVGLAEVLHRAQAKLVQLEFENRSKEQLSIFIEQSPVAIALFDRDMRCIAASSRWKSDYHLDENSSGLFNDNVSPQSVERWNELRRRGLTGEVLRADAEKFIQPDGSAQWLEWAIRPWYAVNGEIGGIVQFSQDVTQRVLEQERQRNSEARLREAYAATHIGAFEQNLETGIGTWSPEMEAMHGLPRGGFPGAHEAWIALIHPDDQERVRDLTERLLSSREWLEAEWRVQWPDGTTHWISARRQVIGDPSGKPLRITGVCLEITERKVAEAAFRDSQEALRAIVDTAMDGIIVIDEARAIQSINPAALKLFGYDLGETIGRNVKMLMPGHFKNQHDAYVEHYLGTGERKIIGIGRVVTGQRRDGTSFPIELAVGEANLTERRIFVGFIRDMTQIDRESRRASALQSELIHVSRLSELGQMASNLAHEVNQPLTAIMNFTQAAGQGLRRGDFTSFADLIERIEAQASRASDIVKRLRAFIDKREVERRPEDLRIIVEEALGIAILDRGARNLRTVLKMSSERPIVTVDRVQIQQVLVNFLRNANDAMATTQDPEISVELTIDEAGMARIAISDNGPGVDPEVADALFAPFVTTKSEGMGIGLSICKTIVESHGGSIGFHANMTGGATFYFTLPLTTHDTATGIQA